MLGIYGRTLYTHFRNTFYIRINKQYYLLLQKKTMKLQVMNNCITIVESMKSM